jgi:Mce-associated membrane protein
MTAAASRRPALWVLAVALCITTLAAATIAVWQLQQRQRDRPPPPVADQPLQREAVTSAGRNGAEKILTYSFEHLDQDFSAAEELLTGDFLTYFKSFTSTQVRPTALNKHITQTASVVRIGIDTLTPQAASLVLFIDQTTSSRDRPEPLKTTSAVHESLVKVDSTWLINKFDPL